MLLAPVSLGFARPGDFGAAHAALALGNAVFVAPPAVVFARLVAALFGLGLSIDLLGLLGLALPAAPREQREGHDQRQPEAAS